MRAAVVLAAAALLIGPNIGTAEAQSRHGASRWCAEYGSGHGGRNCGFSSLRQCRAAISGDSSARCVNTRTGRARR